MTPRSAASHIETYLAGLRAELDAVGAAGVEDIVAEVRSLLVDAAGDNAESAASEIDRMGSPADLAAGILAERGLDSAGGMSTADWWRVGMAAPIDIVIGVSLPAAALMLVLRVLGSLEPGTGFTGARLPVLLAVMALFAGSLVWPWWVWRPWRRGGSPVSAGMALTGIAVVRAPGHHRVVRSADLADLGLRPARRTVLSGALTLAAALVLLLLVAFSGPPIMATLDQDARPTGASDVAAGDAGEAEARTVVETLYGLLVDGKAENGTRLVADGSLEDYYLLADRVAGNAEMRDLEVIEGELVSDGVWRFGLGPRSRAGARRLSVTLSRRTTARVDGASVDWIVTGIDLTGTSAAP